MEPRINNVTTDTLIAEMKTLYNSSNNSIVFSSLFIDDKIYVYNRKFKKFIMNKYGISNGQYRKLISHAKCTIGTQGTYYRKFSRNPQSHKSPICSVGGGINYRCYQLSSAAAEEVTGNVCTSRKSTDIPVSKKPVSKIHPTKKSKSTDKIGVLTNALLSIREVINSVGCSKSVVDKRISEDLDSLSTKVNKVISKIVVRNALQIFKEFDGTDASLEDIIGTNVIDYIGNAISK